MKRLARTLRNAGLVAALSCLVTPALAAQPGDAWITTKVKMALLTDDNEVADDELNKAHVSTVLKRDKALSQSDIEVESVNEGIGVNVDTRAGVVTLFGSVPSQDLKARATTQARGVAGVKGVENELQVVPESMAKRVEANDEQVRAAVREQLGAHDSLEDSDIDVAVKNGVVRVTGTVASQGDRLTALTVARATPGVGSVIDGLELKRPRA